MKDRVVQAAAKLVLEPIFEADFQPCSFGFRPKRSATDALEVLREQGKQCNHVFDADIRNYFEEIDHDKLMKLVEARVSDRRVLRLVRQWLRAGVSWGQRGFEFLGCELRKVMSGKIWEERRERVYYLHRRPSRRSMQRIRDKIRVKTHRGRCHADLREVIAEINAPLIGWGGYFHSLGLYRLRGTVRYPGGFVTPPRETSSASRVRENRTHGLKGGLAITRPSTGKG